MSEDYFDKLFLIESLDQAYLAYKKAEHSAGKNICMDTNEFLTNISTVWKDASETATAISKFDELNDTIEIAIVDDDFNESFVLAVPRDPKTESEKLILSILNSGEMNSLFLGMLKTLKDKENQSDKAKAEDDDIEEISDEDIEVIASRIDLLSNKAVGIREIYTLELAASKIRELKGN